jgi:hypothetical protein
MKYLDQLQSLDETTKKKVLVVATAILMVAIVYFWLAYFNGIIVGLAGGGQAVAQASPSNTNAAASVPALTVNGTANSATPAAPAAPAGPSMFARMGGGLAAIYASFGNILSDLGSMLRAPRQYIVKPQE